jgi:hypothetical protein
MGPGAGAWSKIIMLPNMYILASVQLHVGKGRQYIFPFGFQQQRSNWYNKASYLSFTVSECSLWRFLMRYTTLRSRKRLDFESNISGVATPTINTAGKITGIL